MSIQDCTVVRCSRRTYCGLLHVMLLIFDLNACVEHSARRLLMVGLAEAAAEKTMVRSQAGIRGAFVVETASGGKSGLAVQLEGSRFETVWQLKEGTPGGPMDMNKVLLSFS